MSRRLALLIGNSEYADDRLTRLRTPDADVSDLGDVLKAPAIGAFDDVVTLPNPDSNAARRAIAQHFARKEPDDLLLLFFSGHGVRDENGDLYLAVKDTDHGLLSATAVPAVFVTGEMDRSRSRRQVLILDCCHSGAFARGMKAIVHESVGTGPAFEGSGYGRVVLTASDATEYAWEGETLLGEGGSSVFSRFLIHGLRSGEADLDRDGRITTDEIFDYASGRVAAVTSRQRPGKWTYKQQGEILIAHNPSPSVKPVGLPVEFVHAMESPLASVRRAVVADLTGYLNGLHLGYRAAAREALERLGHDDSQQVVAAARLALGDTDRTNVQKHSNSGQSAVSNAPSLREWTPDETDPVKPSAMIDPSPPAGSKSNDIESGSVALTPHAARKDKPFVNSLGMKFVPVPGTAVWFSIWETRVVDFCAFFNETSYSADAGMYSLGTDGWKQRGNTWRNPGPGFNQTDAHPVVGVSYDDAQAFCRWLTKKDIAAGKLSNDQFYRLPKDAEWSVAVGLPPERGAAPNDKDGMIKAIYPWEGAFPPPATVGNYAGRESKIGHEPAGWTMIDTLSDGFARTSPVGKFAPNRFGLYDLGGNVWEWCEDWYDTNQKYRVLRGASWSDVIPTNLLSSNRGARASDDRFDRNGFRVVVARK